MALSPTYKGLCGVWGEGRGMMSGAQDKPTDIPNLSAPLHDE
jgi:hypothetical protein